VFLHLRIAQRVPIADSLNRRQLLVREAKYNRLLNAFQNYNVTAWNWLWR